MLKTFWLASRVQSVTARTCANFPTDRHTTISQRVVSVMPGVLHDQISTAGLRIPFQGSVPLTMASAPGGAQDDKVAALSNQIARMNTVLDQHASAQQFLLEEVARLHRHLATQGLIPDDHSWQIQEVHTHVPQSLKCFSR